LLAGISSFFARHLVCCVHVMSYYEM